MTLWAGLFLHLYKNIRARFISHCISFYCHPINYSSMYERGRVCRACVSLFLRLSVVSLRTLSPHSQSERLTKSSIHIKR